MLLAPVFCRPVVPPRDRLGTDLGHDERTVIEPRRPDRGLDAVQLARYVFDPAPVPARVGVHGHNVGQVG